MSALKKIREWLATFPGYERLQSLQVDYLAAEPNSSSIAPSGLVEVSRKENIFGEVTVVKQYNFGLYYVFAKATEDDEGSTENAEWITDLQEWVLEQSILGRAPTFGETAPYTVQQRKALQSIWCSFPLNSSRNT